MNMARVAMVLAGLPHSVGGVTVNRFCASGLTALQMAADRIRVGEADVMIAGGAESMSLVPMTGNKPSFNPEVFARDENVGIAYGMGLTAEKVAAQWKVSPRGAGRLCAAVAPAGAGGHPGRRVCRRDDAGQVVERTPDLATAAASRQDAHRRTRRRPAPRHHAGRPGQAAPGVRRQGQRHRRQQQPDQRRRRCADPGQREGREAFDLKPLARFVSFAARGVPPEIMGIGPIEAIPAALRYAGLKPGRHRLDRAERGLRRAALAVMNTWASTRPRSTRWAAPSRWATRWAPPAPSAPPPSCMRCAATS
jgi:acetyl-CoA acyltransferase